MLDDLYNIALQAAQSAYCPYSKFSVGAAVLLDNEVIITGSNQENASFSLTMCAERVAIFYANSQYPMSKVVAIAIASPSTSQIITPCGACRQVMCEVIKRQSADFTVVMRDKTMNASELLPLSFTLG